jgi:quercetin dioxygenase-like cupin family protein
MIVKKSEDVDKTLVVKEGVKDVWIRWLIGKDSQAPNFYLRQFEIAPGGHTPFHAHPWEHEVYILEGQGQLKTESKPIPIKKGDFALVSPGEKHQFENTGEGRLTFLCIIPLDGE